MQNIRDGDRVAGEAIEYVGLIGDFARCSKHAIREVLTPRDKQYKVWHSQMHRVSR